MGYYFMNNEIYEQVVFSDKIVEYVYFFKEGMEVDVIYYVDCEVLLIMEMFQYIIFEVIYIELGVKGDIVINILKLVIVEIGVEVWVFLFINQGDKVKIEVEIGVYMECVK